MSTSTIWWTSKKRTTKKQYKSNENNRTYLCIFVVEIKAISLQNVTVAFDIFHCQIKQNRYELRVAWPPGFAQWQQDGHVQLCFVCGGRHRWTNAQTSQWDENEGKQQTRYPSYCHYGEQESYWRLRIRHSTRNSNQADNIKRSRDHWFPAPDAFFASSSLAWTRFFKIIKLRLCVWYQTDFVRINRGAFSYSPCNEVNEEMIASRACSPVIDLLCILYIPNIVTFPNKPTPVYHFLKVDLDERERKIKGHRLRLPIFTVKEDKTKFCVRH